MKLRRHTNQPSERDLAALVDGSLPAARRPEVERAVAASADLQAGIAAQHRALNAVREAASEGAPVSLRSRVALAARPRKRSSAQRTLGAVMATGLAGVIVAIAVLAGGSAGGATVAQASVVAARPAQATAPASRADTPALPRIRAAGLPYPYWEDAFGYRAVGVRYDTLGGHLATTVFYVRGGAHVAYTIVAGPALPPGEPTRSTSINGVRLSTLSAHGRWVVTWVRAGHTCVLTGSGTTATTLLRLASWRHGGEVPY